MPHRRSQDIATTALIPFFALAFAFAWGALSLFFLAPGALERAFGPPSGHHPVFVLATYAPALAAFLLVALRGGAGALAAFLSRLGLWRAPAAWWAVLLAGPPAMFFAGAALKGDAALVRFDGPGALFGALGFMLVLGPVEEFGWRGFALPLLQRRMAPFWAGLVLGLVWAVWHLPVFFIAGTPQSGWSLLPFMAGSVAASVILTPIFNAARGSLLLAVLFHFQLVNPLWPDGQPHDTAFFLALAAAVTWVARGSMFRRAGAATTVVPEPGKAAGKGRAEGL